ncbi:MAG: DUF2905 domain-containing protein [Chloroflexi bacterium]|nr:DUF2905 domain-containing protein [Chloroflexota bacterium]
MGKFIIAAGVFLFVLGILLTLAPKIPFPGRLPGDFVFEKGNFRLFIPLASSLIISLVLSVLLTVLFKIFR